MRFMRCEQDHNCARKDGHVRSAGCPSGLGPEAYLADVLARVADDPASRIAAGKLADQPADARDATAELAAAYEPADLYRRGFRLYASRGGRACSHPARAMAQRSWR
jgi:hypothetical protein